ncbi:hypothetical protein [Atopobacter phocae]|uniref:hypothetical protein n=1 Tax=Atopobacter phocae TaxID=136492 RepID=UPI00047204D5|nr:hypothetical protein [Atopobacter phocae]
MKQHLKATSITKKSLAKPFYQGYKQDYINSQRQGNKLVKNYVAVFINNDGEIIYEAETKGLVNQWRIKHNMAGRIGYRHVKTNKITV